MRTAVWTNTAWVPQRPLFKHDCAASDGKKHTASAQRDGVEADPRYSLNELYSIPVNLREEIA